MPSEKRFRVSIEWYRATKPNVTTTVTVWARDSMTAVAIAVCVTDRPTNAIGMAVPTRVEVSDAD